MGRSPPVATIADRVSRVVGSQATQEGGQKEHVVTGDLCECDLSFCRMHWEWDELDEENTEGVPSKRRCITTRHGVEPFQQHVPAAESFSCAGLDVLHILHSMEHSASD